MRCRVLKSWKESIATWVPEENMDDVGIRSTISEEYYNISQMRGRVMKSSESTAIWAHERETRGDVVILSVNIEEYSILLISRVLESSKRVPTCEYVRGGRRLNWHIEHCSFSLIPAMLCYFVLIVVHRQGFLWEVARRKLPTLVCWILISGRNG